MVNTGKPSRGCYMCRARRIKCDEGRPGCNRCLKSKRICPGYRDPFEVNLRDETKSTKKKMSRMISQRSFVDVQQYQVPQHDYLLTDGFSNQTPITASNLTIYDSAQSSWKYTKQRSRNSISSLSSMSSMSSMSSLSSPTSTTSNISTQSGNHFGCITAYINTPVDQQAACYFLSNFVLLSEQGVLRGYLEFLPSMLNNENPNSAVHAAFSAAALAAFGTRTNSKAILPQADQSYCNALQLIKKAVADPKTASNDTTIVAVLMLTFFEQLTAPRRTHLGWSSHVDGAAALLKARGPSTFQNPQGREVWNTVRALMTIQRIAVSKEVDDGEEWWMSVPATDGHSHQFASLNIRVAKLRADNDKITSQRSHDNREHVIALLRRAHDLEKEYVGWFAGLTGEWAVKTVCWMEHQELDLENSIVHPGKIDSYSEMWMAYHHNIGRSSRIFIWTTILRCVAWLCDGGDYKLTEEFATASRVCRGLVEDIVASIPFIFGWNKETDKSMQDRSCFACGTSEGEVKSLWGIFVMWPMFAAAVSDFSLPSERIFLRGRLKYISENMGIYQAAIILRATVQLPSFYIECESMALDPHASCHNRNKEIEAAFDDEGVVFESILEGAPMEEGNWDLFSATSDMPVISARDITFDPSCIPESGCYTLVV